MTDALTRVMADRGELALAMVMAKIVRCLELGVLTGFHMTRTYDLSEEDLKVRIEARNLHGASQRTLSALSADNPACLSVAIELCVRDVVGDRILL